MAATTTANGGELSITVLSTTATPVGAAGGEERRTETTAVKPESKLRLLDKMVFCVALLEWAGNAAGVLAFLWASAVLLGGFCSLLIPEDFWFATVMIFVEAIRVFIRNDALISRWLFGSTRAFRRIDFSFPRMLVQSQTGRLTAVVIALCINLIPKFPPEIVVGILKLSVLVIISQSLTRLRGRTAKIVLTVFSAAAFCGGVWYSLSMLLSSKSEWKNWGLFVAWFAGTLLLPLGAVPLVTMIFTRLPSMTNPIAQLLVKVTIAVGLACLPLLQKILASYYTYCSITIAVLLLTVSSISTAMLSEQDNNGSNNNNSSIDGQYGLFIHIADTIQPILFFWSVMFPLPGISLKMTFFMLVPVLAAVLVGNLQIPVAFLQIVLSILRLRSLLGHHRHDYGPLPLGASPNLVPSIVVFFMLELCQGSSYMMAIILGVISLPLRRLLVHDMGFTGDQWGAKAVDLYYHRAYQRRTENGLFPSEKGYMPSLHIFAIESLGCSEREMQIVGLHIIGVCLHRGDYCSVSNNKLITEIAKDATNIIAKIVGLISYFADEENCREEGADAQQHKKVLCLSLNFLRRLATNGRQNGARFRRELSKNPFFLNCLESILDSDDDRHIELWEPVMDIIAKLALDKAARRQIGSTQTIMSTLLHVFPDDVNPIENNDCALRMAAGEALVNLTIMSADNCWAILLAEPGHNLIDNLVNMLENEAYMCIAANLLHNLCANSRDKLIGLGANTHLESALRKVLEVVMTKEGKQLEAALSAASQIGYAIPEYLAMVLESDTDAAALAKKIVYTLNNSNKKPCPDYPRMRRALVEVVISIVDLCPRYKSIFRENGAKDALGMVIRNPSKLDKYRVFLGGKGVVMESLPMRDLVDKANRLIHQATPTSSFQPWGRV